MKSQILVAVILILFTLILNVQGEVIHNSLLKIYRGGNIETLSVIKSAEKKSQFIMNPSAKASLNFKRGIHEGFSVLKNPSESLTIMKFGGSKTEVELKCPSSRNDIQKP